MPTFNSYLNNFLSQKIVISLLINTFLFSLVYFFLIPIYKLDDIYVMTISSGFYTGEPSEFLIVCNVIFGRLLNFLYNSFPQVNWYTFILTGLNFICMTLILYMVIRRSNSFISYLIFLLIFISFGIEFYFRVHFTYIAFLCGFTGLYLILFQDINKSFVRRLFWHLLIIFLFICAFLVRKESFYGVFAISISLIIYYFIKTRNTSFVVIFAIVVSIGFLLKIYDEQYIEKNFEPGYSEYLKAQYILNSENKIPKEITTEILENYNWSNNDIKLIDSWFWVDNNVFSKENLINFSLQVNRNRTFAETINYLFYRVIYKGATIKYFLFLLIVIILSLPNKKTRHILFLTLLNVLIVCVGLVYFQNLPDRVVRPVWFFTISANLLSILYYGNIKDLMKTKYLRYLLISLSFSVVIISLIQLKIQNDFSRQIRNKFNNVIYEINNNTQSVFVFRSIWDLAGFPVYSPPNRYSTKNIIITDFFTYSQVYYDILVYHHINDNLMTEILEHDKLYLVDSSSLGDVFIKFYSEHYQIDVCFEKIKHFKYLDVSKISRCQDVFK